MFLTTSHEQEYAKQVDAEIKREVQERLMRESYLQDKCIKWRLAGRQAFFTDEFPRMVEFGVAAAQAGENKPGITRFGDAAFVQQQLDAWLTGESWFAAGEGRWRARELRVVAAIQRHLPDVAPLDFAEARRRAIAAEPRNTPAPRPARQPNAKVAASPAQPEKSPPLNLAFAGLGNLIAGKNGK